MALLTPASSAISWVRAPAKPLRANTSSAHAMMRSLLSTGGCAGAGRRPPRRLTRLASMSEQLAHVLEHDEHDEPHQQHRADHVDALLDALVDAAAGNQLIGQKREPPTVERRHREQVEEAQEDGKIGDDAQRLARALLDLFAELVGDLDGPRHVGFL